jgi:hypothetical protein
MGYGLLGYGLLGYGLLGYGLLAMGYGVSVRLWAIGAIGLLVLWLLAIGLFG